MNPENGDSHLMSTLLLLHLTGLALWFGVIGVEFVMERGRARGREVGYAVARFHYQTDLYLEMPAFTLVLVTGALMVDPARLHGLYLLKVGAGIVAIGMNALSMVPVVLRKRAADADRLQDVIRYSRWIDRTVPLGLGAAVVALGIGLYWLS